MLALREDWKALRNARNACSGFAIGFFLCIVISFVPQKLDSREKHNSQAEASAFVITRDEYKTSFNDVANSCHTSFKGKVTNQFGCVTLAVAIVM